MLGIKLYNFEESRASKVYGINHRIPEQTTDLLKTDEDRRKSVQ